MSSIISNSLRILNSETFAKRIAEQPTYLFIGKDTSWADEELPDIPTESTKDLTQLYKNMLAVKRVTADTMTSVIQRINWTSNSVYDAFDDTLNMVDDRKSNGTRYRYYALTDEFNVYKCLSNNNGAASVNKPTSQQITEFKTPDGYIWKYMYTIRSTDVFSFLTQDWMPVYTIIANDGSSQWQVQENAIDGGIHDIVVKTSGASYNPAIPPTVVITGDGTGATAQADVHPISGAITRILITNPGLNYTTATVTLTNIGSGNGCTSVAIIAPVGGHGKDAKLELGGVNKMIKMTLNGAEGGAFPTTTFRQAGLLYKPLSTEQGSKITVASTNGFKAGETVTGDTTGATGVIRLVDDNERTLWIDTVVGAFIQSETISSDGVSAAIERVVNNTNLVLVSTVASADDVVTRTGEFMYISNREVIARNDTQTEEVRFIIGF
jgi:hypothetical protein